MAGLAAARRMDAQAATLRMAMQAALRDRADYSRHDLDLHRQVAAATGNPLYPMFIEDMQQALPSDVALNLRQHAGPAELAQVQAVHQAVFDAVASGEIAAARDAMAARFDDAAHGNRHHVGLPSLHRPV